jgi:hypothetical protein
MPYQQRMRPDPLEASGAQRIHCGRFIVTRQAHNRARAFSGEDAQRKFQQRTGDRL